VVAWRRRSGGGGEVEMGAKFAKLERNKAARRAKDKGKDKAGGGGGGAAASLDNQAPPPTDPRLPLTAKQKYTLVASWKGISREMEATGIAMFIK